MTTLLGAFSRKARKWLNTWNDTPFVRKYGTAYRAMQGFRSVEGFLTEHEAIFLHDTAQAIDSPAPVVVEIGSWLGKSSVAISHGLAGKEGARLYCIDPFNAAGDPFSAPTYEAQQQQLQKSLLESFRENIAAYGVPGVVQAIQGYSYDVATEWDTPIDFLFIDASHEYEDVLRDFVDWSPHVKPGGVVAFHDVRLDARRMELSGPAQVIRDHIFQDDTWETITEPLVNSIYAARKRS